jgi:SAM-dependent methyltransferase
MVSDVGSFSELPDDICLKVPVGIHEEDLIFEYLNTLVMRPDLTLAMGARAKAWVETECRWDVVADKYTDFLEQVATGRVASFSPVVPSVADSALPEESPAKATEADEVPLLAVEEPPFEAEADAAEAAPGAGEPEIDPIDPVVFETWLSPEGRSYAAHHKSRFIHTLEITPPGDASKSILEMGAYMQITPALQHKLGYGYVRGCYYGPEGRIDHKSLVAENGETFECDVDHFDAEKHVYPYGDEAFDTVMCCELIEHLFEDPMFMMSEINRILKPGGHLVLTTPNAGSLRAVSAILLGYHPAFFPAYIRPRKEGEEAEARHNREYVPMEVQHLLTDSGFDLVRLETGEFLEEPHPELGWVTHMLTRYKLSHNLRGDGIYAVGRKAGPVRTRWPGWLYQ